MLFLVTYDTIYDEHQEPLACDIVSKLQLAGRDYWLLKTSQPFPHFTITHFDSRSIADHKGPRGERFPSDMLLVTPRHAGFTFEHMAHEALHIHICVPRSDRYPPDTTCLDLADYIHMYWGLLYPDRTYAEGRLHSF